MKRAETIFIAFVGVPVAIAMWALAWWVWRG